MQYSSTTSLAMHLSAYPSVLPFRTSASLPSPHPPCPLHPSRSSPLLSPPSPCPLPSHPIPFLSSPLSLSSSLPSYPSPFLSPLSFPPPLPPGSTTTVRCMMRSSLPSLQMSTYCGPLAMPELSCTLLRELTLPSWKGGPLCVYLISWEWKLRYVTSAKTLGIYL